MNIEKEKEFLKSNYPRNLQQYIERELFFYKTTKKVREKTLRDAKLEFAENVLGAMSKSKNENINYIVIDRKSYSRRNETNSYMKCIISFIDYCIVIKKENQEYFEKVFVKLEKMFEILLKYGIDIMLNKTQIMLNFKKSFKRRISEKKKK